MNRIHRTVFNARLGTVVAVAETARSRGKAGASTGVAGALLASALLATPAFGQVAAGALPTGGQVSAGQAAIATSGSAMTVTQTSQRAAINWQSFNVGSNASVQFNQPNASAVVLNRVVGNEGSVINGALRANGQVWLLNPNGVLFNSGARVDVGGLLASTRSLSDADFMAGRATLQGSGPGEVINLGQIHAADGGYVALIGRAVKNDGTVTARLGTVAAAAGDKVTLNFNGDSLVGVAIDQGTLDALVRNGGAMRADGGQIILTAKTASALLDAVVNTTGELRAQTIANREGRILLLSDMEHGRTEVAGTLDASAPTTGNGGFIETSAAHVNVADGTRVTTAATQGHAGTWLIDPTDFAISAGSGAQTSAGIGATTLQNALAAGNVTIQTQSAGSEDGDINVNAAVSWSANKLTLEAHGDINVNAVMTASGSSTLDLKAGYNFNTGSPAYDASKAVRMGMATNANHATTFTGRIDFDRTGAGLLTINGNGYTLINALGSAGSTTGTDLQGINGALTGYFALSTNIDASATSAWNSGAGFTPIGNNSAWFNGEFNGLGHTITGLTIQRPGSDHVGLFGYAAEGNGLSNVGLVNASITGRNYVGALLGLISGTGTRTDKGLSINNVFTSGTVTGTGTSWSYVGGVFGAVMLGRYDTAAGWVSDIVSSASVTAAGTSVGGIAGAMYDQQFDGGTSMALTIDRLRAYGNVTTTKTGRSDAGGLIGYLSESTLSDSFALGTVQGGDSAGGLVGVSDWMTTIQRSYAAGASVTGGSEVGGLVGSNYGIVIESYASANVTGSSGGSYAGGLVGRNGHTGWAVGATINFSFATGSVSGNDYVGGLVGYQQDDSIINKSYSTGAVTGNTNVGGSVGARDLTAAQNETFWNTQTSGISTDGAGGSGGVATGATSAEMVSIDTFAGPNLAFFQQWDIVADANVLATSAPVLRWMVPSASAGSSVWIIGTGVAQVSPPPGGGQPAPAPAPAVTSPLEPVIAQAVRTAVQPLPPTLADGDRASPVQRPQAARPNVAVAPSQLAAALGSASDLLVVSSPDGQEPSEGVTLAQARRMVGGSGASTSPAGTDVRVPLGRNSMADIVNGGVRLPSGVDQLLFVVKTN
jgi:filamentous hemagglutinin family protein